MDVALVLAATLLIGTNAGKLRQNADARAMLREVAASPPGGAAEAFRASSSNLARGLTKEIEVAAVYNARLTAMLAEMWHPSFADIGSLVKLADASWRASIIPLLEHRRAIAAGLAPRLDATEADLMEQLRVLRRNDQPSSHQASFIQGVTEALETRRPLLVTLLIATDRFYARALDLVRYLETPSGRPSLSANGTLLYATDVGVAGFQAAATAVDAARDVFNQSIEALDADYKRRE